ncbi:unnamed protein product [Rhizopus stolonifer]
MNGVKLLKLGAKQFGKKIDNLLDAVDKENCDPSQPADVTTTVKQQQQYVLEEYVEYMIMTEADGVAFKDSTIGTIVKQKVIDIFYKWKNDMPVSDQELVTLELDSRWTCGCCLIRTKTNTAYLPSKLQRRATHPNCDMTFAN